MCTCLSATKLEPLSTRVSHEHYCVKLTLSSSTADSSSYNQAQSFDRRTRRSSLLLALLFFALFPSFSAILLVIATIPALLLLLAIIFVVTTVGVVAVTVPILVKQIVVLLDFGSEAQVEFQGVQGVQIVQIVGGFVCLSELLHDLVVF